MDGYRYLIFRYRNLGTRWMAERCRHCEERGRIVYEGPLEAGMGETPRLYVRACVRWDERKVRTWKFDPSLLINRALTLWGLALASPGLKRHVTMCCTQCNFKIGCVGFGAGAGG